MGFVSLVPVAAPSHPLALAQTPIPRSVARQYTQIVITDVTDQTRGRDFGVIGDRTRRMTDMGSSMNSRSRDSAEVVSLMPKSPGTSTKVGWFVSIWRTIRRQSTEPPNCPSGCIATIGIARTAA
jgi:hypothetical protein